MFRRSPGVSSAGVFSRNRLSPFSSFEPRFYFEADGGANPPAGGQNNSGDPAGAENGNGNPSGTNPGGQSVQDAVKLAIADLLGRKGGDKDEALDTLYRENHKLRQRAEDAEGKQLSKADRDTLANFKALNLSLDDVKRIVGEHQQWSIERARNAKVDTLKKAAMAAGLNGDLLASLEGALDVEYSVIGEGENAKAMVKLTNGDTKTDKALDEWVAEKWPALKDTLKAAPVNNQQNTQTRTVARYGQSAGVGASSGQSRDRVQERLDARREANKDKKNPLMA